MNKEFGIYWRKWTFLGHTKSTGGLSFRDLEVFNKTLLAKQLQRIIEQPDSLVDQILKFKYFPYIGVLDSKLGHSISQIWRSIRSSIDLVKECILWRIRDDHSINIWGANWLPTPSTFRIQSPMSLLDNTAKVESLIDINIRSWNRQLIFQLFAHEGGPSYMKHTSQFIWGSK